MISFFFQEKDVERGECSLAAVTGIVNNPKLLLWTKQVTVHSAVVCLVAKPLNRSEAKGDHALIQNLLLSNVNYFVFYAN